MRSQRKEILEHVALREALEDAMERDSTYIPNSGNLGDGVIALGNSHLFDEWRLNFRVDQFSREAVVNSKSHLLLGGGGGLIRGLYYELGSYLLRFLELGGTACILPSTIKDFGCEFAKYADQLTIFAREKTTYNELLRSGMPPSRLHLCHDLAFALSPTWLEAQKQADAGGTLMAFRADDEATFVPNVDLNIDLSLFLNGPLWHDRAFTEVCVSRLAKFIGTYSSVKTNRLHIGILSFLLDVDVTIFDNAYGKNGSIYENSLLEEFRVKFVKAEGIPVEGSELIIDPPSWEGFRRKLAWYEKTRHEWWEPQIESLTKDLQAQLDVRKNWFEPELDRLNATLVKNDSEKSELSNNIEILTQRVALLTMQYQESDSKNGDLEKRVKDLTDSLLELEHTRSGERILSAELRTKDAEFSQLQSELLKYKANFLHERARVSAIGSQIEHLRRQITNAKEELANAKKVSDELWDTKIEWWEPELERRAAKIEWLEEENLRLRKSLSEK